jgi:hypothetical protein
MRRNHAHLLGLSALLFAAGCSGQPQTTVTQGQIMVTVSPGITNLSILGTQQFTATVTGTTNTAVRWEVNGVTGGSLANGFISSTGLFVAPANAPTNTDGTSKDIVITAVSQANAAASGTAMVGISATSNQSKQSTPVKLGTSGGNISDHNGNSCCGGTLGSLLTRNGVQYILSNNHVLAKSDFAKIGDVISQPGIIDVPVPNTCTPTGTSTVANLSEFFNLQGAQTPKVDAAIAAVVSGQVDPAGNILLLGATQTGGLPDPGQPVAGTGLPATVAMNVAKSGRTTALTCSSVIGINVIANVDYFKNCGDTVKTFTAMYSDLVQVQGGTFSASGDSGSLIVQMETAKPVALLFAGSDTDTIGNAIADVLNAFPGAGNVTPTFVGTNTPHQVIGCTLPNKPASAVQTLAAVAMQGSALQRALVARDRHAPELLGHPEVQAVGVGASYDNPAQAAILLFVTKGQPRTELPLQLDGVRTRIIEGEFFAHRGSLSTDDSAELERSGPAPQMVYPISDAEVARAKVVHKAHADELMNEAGMQGVGITSSVDSPGEAALLIVTIRGVAHDAIPPVIDGLRTRVRESSRFKAGQGDANARTTCGIPKVLAAREAQSGKKLN